MVFIVIIIILYYIKYNQNKYIYPHIFCGTITLRNNNEYKKLKY